MTNYEIGQSKIVSTSGPGSLTILQEGMSVMMPGLDSWYRIDSPVQAGQDFELRKQEIPDDVRLVDRKLSKYLGVDFFVRPPTQGQDPTHPHTEYLDVLLFPSWMVCYKCRRLSKETPQGQFLPTCQSCLQTDKRQRKLTQVNFVVACQKGHISEFPWVEWVHRSASVICENPSLKLETKGAGELASQKITCSSCKKYRNLARVNEGFERDPKASQTEKTYLGMKLSEDGAQFYCPGTSPWLGKKEDCHQHPKMVLRAATNAYYSFAAKSIFLPTDIHSESEIDKRISDNEQELLVLEFKASGIEELVNVLRFAPNLKHLGLSDFDAQDLHEALERFFNKEDEHSGADESSLEGDELALVSPEFEALSKPHEKKDLVIREVPLEDGRFQGISKINAVHRLTVTKAFAGFSRLIPKVPSPSEAKAQMRSNPHAPKNKWLPAVQGVGEGIFIEFDKNYLEGWEKSSSVQNRIDKIRNNFFKSPHYDSTNLLPRKVLIHTLSHLLIQQLTNDSGYTATALSEKIYASPEMAGLLIYTASEDADGTMGGLVQLANVEYLTSTLQRAFQQASWCSNDPICMDMGNTDGQGDFGTNLAACYLCSMLPETACEHFNQFLDRAMVVPLEAAGKESAAYFTD